MVRYIKLKSGVNLLKTSIILFLMLTGFMALGCLKGNDDLIGTWENININVNGDSALCSYSFFEDGSFQEMCKLKKNDSIFFCVIGWYRAKNISNKILFEVAYSLDGSINDSIFLPEVTEYISKIKIDKSGKLQVSCNIPKEVKATSGIKTYKYYKSLKSEYKFYNKIPKLNKINPKVKNPNN